MDAGQGIDTSRSNWVFDEKVAPKFDEHVRKSVPDYDRIQDLAASFADWFVKDGGTVVDLGASTGETLLQKLFDECDPVRRLFPLNPHKKRNHTIHFANGMPLWILGAHNKTNLQRRSIRWVFADETWVYPAGHMAEAEARVTAFGWLGKCIFMSQGGEEDDDTHRKFETTDMREWTFACPHCGHRQSFDWENVEWSKSARQADGEWDFSEVRATLHAMFQR